ncbi:MAG: lipid-A-disaccharide synthase, partial [Thermoguttaceae bacterium]|nr:lipid-A-disaccharide synthase [Thermoguttaceae bacterium]
MMTTKESVFSTETNAPLFFISAGDPSGDVHAARLVEALSQRLPNARFVGFAGPRTKATRCDVRVDLTQFAVMMLKNALLNLFTYVKLLNQAGAIFRKERPDAVILVDFPGFNWQIAKKAKAEGIPVVYFMPPQMWGWGQWRVKKMRKYVDLVLSCFSFEDAWFTERQCRSTLVGHPFFEESRSKKIDDNFITSLNSTESGVSSSAPSTPSPGQKRYLTVLPGSRNQEVANNLTNLVATIEKVVKVTPDVQPIFAAFCDAQANEVRNLLKERGLDYPVYAGKTSELMRVATCCLGVSG